MRTFPVAAAARAGLIALLALNVFACGRGASKPDVVQAADTPSSFDVTLTAEKDTQFDFDGAPLTAEDLKSAFRYRQEESLPMATVLLKRGEKQKVKNEHLVALARLAYQMKFRAYYDDDGQIAEVRAQLKDPDKDKLPVSEPSQAPKRAPTH